ncbi:MAG: hypothetical protein EAZ14_04090 [Runella slithyformis]|nr:MAG: hypothetical protein EAZ14_04090 [Runella slithyformis]
MRTKTRKKTALFLCFRTMQLGIKNLNTPIATVFVENVVNLRNEFELMCHCKHHIMANSTLSWWADWLNTNPAKTVIEPQRWFNDHATRRVYCPMIGKNQ